MGRVAAMALQGLATLVVAGQREARTIVTTTDLLGPAVGERRRARVKLPRRKLPKHHVKLCQGRKRLRKPHQRESHRRNEPRVSVSQASLDGWPVEAPRRKIREPGADGFECRFMNNGMR